MSATDPDAGNRYPNGKGVRGEGLHTLVLADLLQLILKTAVDCHYPVAGSNFRPSAGPNVSNIFL